MLQMVVLTGLFFFFFGLIHGISISYLLRFFFCSSKHPSRSSVKLFGSCHRWAQNLWSQNAGWYVAGAHTRHLFSRTDNPGVKLENGVKIVLNLSKLCDVGSDRSFIVHTVIGLV